MEIEWIPALLCAVVAAGEYPELADISRSPWRFYTASRSGGRAGIPLCHGAIFASLLFLIPFLLGGVSGGEFKLIVALGSFPSPWNGIRAAKGPGKEG